MSRRLVISFLTSSGRMSRKSLSNDLGEGREHIGHTFEATCQCWHSNLLCPCTWGSMETPHALGMTGHGAAFVFPVQNSPQFQTIPFFPTCQRFPAWMYPINHYIPDEHPQELRNLTHVPWLQCVDASNHQSLPCKLVLFGLGEVQYAPPSRVNALAKFVHPGCPLPVRFAFAIPWFAFLRYLSIGQAPFFGIISNSNRKGWARRRTRCCWGLLWRS